MKDLVTVWIHIILGYLILKLAFSKNWRPPRLRAFGSGGRKRNTYEYACLLTRPDCRRTKKKFWLNEFSSFTGRKSGILISIIHEIFWRNLRNKRWHNLKFHLKIFENELLKTKIKILQARKNDTSLALEKVWFSERNSFSKIKVFKKMSSSHFFFDIWCKFCYR